MLNCLAMFSQCCRKFISSGVTLHAAFPLLESELSFQLPDCLGEPFGFKLLFKPKVQFLRLQNRNLERIAY